MSHYKRRSERHSAYNRALDSCLRRDNAHIRQSADWDDDDHWYDLEARTDWKRYHRDDLTWDDEGGRRNSGWYCKRASNGWKDRTKRPHQWRPKPLHPAESDPPKRPWHGRKRQPVWSHGIHMWLAIARAARDRV